MAVRIKNKPTTFHENSLIRKAHSKYAFGHKGGKVQKLRIWAFNLSFSNLRAVITKIDMTGRLSDITCPPCLAPQWAHIEDPVVRTLQHHSFPNILLFKLKGNKTTMTK